MEKIFFRGARLSTIIPKDTSRSISDIIEEDDDNQGEGDLLSLRKQRDLLFFDERLRVYIVLKLSIKSADSLESYISRLELKLDIWVANSPNGNKEAGNTQDVGEGHQRELVCSENVKKSEDPMVIIREDDDDSGQLTALLLWETFITLARPRTRFPNAAITIVPSGTYTPEQTAQGNTDDIYLPSFVPPPVNILEPLKVIRGLEENPPYLAASRLERVLPNLPANDNIIRLAFLPSRPTRIVPAMIARLRCSRINTALAANPKTIAALEVEIIPFVEVRGSLKEVEVSLAGGHTEQLGPVTVPMRCRSRDCVTFLYKLHPSKQLSEASNTGVLTINLILKIFVSLNCTSTIFMVWTANVDLSASLNPLYGPPSQPIQRTQRPASLPLMTTLADNYPSTIGTSAPRPSAITTANGLTISFAAPKAPIQLAKPFTWTVLIVNNTPKPVKLALVPLPHIQRAPTPSAHHNKTHAPKTSTASFRSSEKRHISARTAAEGPVDLAQAFCDENIVYAMQHATVTPTSTDIVSLTAELRVGPLGPGACHECQIRMIALRRGALQVDAVRVVDLVREAEEGAGVPGVITDITQLPDVIVV